MDVEPSSENVLPKKRNVDRSSEESPPKKKKIRSFTITNRKH